ncbi:MAG: SLC13 family permease, partial [Alphaproteobacteria bacterium]
MTLEQGTVFAILGAVFALMLWGRWRYDLIAFAALILAVLLGAVPAERAFDGFGHPATIIVALVLVVSAGLVRAGVVMAITRLIADPGRSLRGHILMMGGVGAALSAFMNNVAALALLMPIDLEAARKAGRSPRATLMPLAFATILGGMLTLIGTPPNIIVAGIRADLLGAPFGMFDFTPVGAIVALAGLAYLALVGWRLIPAGEDGAGPPDPAGELGSYIAELHLPRESAEPLPLETIEEAAAEAGVTPVGFLRGGSRVRPRRGMTLAPGDSLLVEARPEALDEFRSRLGLALGGNPRTADLAGAGAEMIEVVVPETSRLVGRTAERVGLAWRKRAALVGIWRHGRPLRGPLRRTPIRAGDVLLLIAPEGSAAEVAEWLGVLPLAGRGVAVARTERLVPAVAIFAAAVAAASFGLVTLPVALAAVVVLYVLAGILPLAEIYDHVEWPVVVLLGAMIPIGGALEATGGTALIGEGLAALLGGLPPWAVLAVLMAVTMSLSDVLNNTATAIVAAPVAVDVAGRLGASPDPFLMAVAVAASCAFLTPIGHK